MTPHHCLRPLFLMQNLFILKNGDVSNKLELYILRNGRVTVISSLKNKIIKIFQKISWPTNISANFADIVLIFFF